ncbi:F0F1 ATP synthase subunit A [Candidatus Margulisiibacteriota bacterium]
MEDIGVVALKSFQLFGLEIIVNLEMFYMTFLVASLLVLFGFLSTRKLSSVPGKLQGFFELILYFVNDITVSTLGEKEGKKFSPLIITIFLFVLLSNWIGIVPNLCEFLGVIIALLHKLIVPGTVEVVAESVTNVFVVPDPQSWYYFLFKIPAINSPTRHLGTNFAVAIIVFLVAHSNAVRCNGIVEYFKGYMEPLPSKPPWIYFFFLNPFFYLNIISQLSNVVSHSFRLFGNIFGGGIIILIVSELLRYFLLPVGLFAFFGLFSGIIQAFVFTMLAITYIATAK